MLEAVRVHPSLRSEQAPLGELVTRRLDRCIGVAASVAARFAPIICCAGGRTTSCRRLSECCAPPPIASHWLLLLLLSPLLSATAASGRVPVVGARLGRERHCVRLPAFGLC
jgi:hypothetical protein